MQNPEQEPRPRKIESVAICNRIRPITNPKLRYITFALAANDEKTPWEGIVYYFASPYGFGEHSELLDQADLEIQRTEDKNSKLARSKNWSIIGGGVLEKKDSTIIYRGPSGYGEIPEDITESFIAQIRYNTESQGP